MIDKWTAEMITADDLRAEFQSRGYRADVLYAKDDPENLKVDMVRVWAGRLDRYPAHCVLGPLDIADCWNWGNRFEYRANPTISAAELANEVIATLLDIRG